MARPERAIERSRLTVVFGPEHRRRARLRFVELGLALSQRLGADLQLIFPDPGYWQDFSAVLARGRRPLRIDATFLPDADQRFVEGALKELERAHPRLVMLDLEQVLETLDARDPAWWEPFLTASEAPVLLSRARRSSIRELFDSFLVPLSGEITRSHSLEEALALARQLELPVDIVHVTETRGKAAWDASILAQVSDEFQHEYPRLIEELVLQASPYSGSEERRRIREVCHCTGDVSQQILLHVRQGRRPLLVLEWKGRLERGRARTMKGLLEQVSCPVLLVRERKGPEARLRVADEFKRA